ncbi:MAG: acyl-CoA thioesterase [Rhodospirillales bacterium]|jgi:acyl-CoA thioester hydrolase
MSASNFREINRRTVTPDLCDELGHMNIQHYYATLSDGMFNVMGLMGMPKEDIPTRRTSLVLYKEEAEFIDELNDADLFYLATALEHVGNKSIIFQHRFFNVQDGRKLFSSRFVAVNMNLDVRTSIPIPANMKAAALKELPPYIED